MAHAVSAGAAGRSSGGDPTAARPVLTPTDPASCFFAAGRERQSTGPGHGFGEIRCGPKHVRLAHFGRHTHVSIAPTPRRPDAPDSALDYGCCNGTVRRRPSRAMTRRRTAARFARTAMRAAAKNASSCCWIYCGRICRLRAWTAQLPVQALVIDTGSKRQSSELVHILECITSFSVMNAKLPRLVSMRYFIRISIYYSMRCAADIFRTSNACRRMIHFRYCLLHVLHVHVLHGRAENEPNGSESLGQPGACHRDPSRGRGKADAVLPHAAIPRLRLGQLRPGGARAGVHSHAWQPRGESWRCWL